jgi:biopolymer transport protein ExbB
MPEWFVKGGIVMWPLLVCSVAAVAIILERLWALQRRRIISPAVSDVILNGENSPGWVEQVRTLCERDRSVLGELARATLAHAALHKSENVEAVQALARQILSRMQRGLTSLSLIVEISPLLGLLGTVIGMVRLFTDVAERGLGEPAAVSRGIFEALITTVTGLAIAIPALVAYMYLHRRIETLVLELERHTNELLARLYR